MKPYNTRSNEKSFPLYPVHCPSYSWFFFQGTLGSLQNLPGVLSAYRTWTYMCILFRSVSEWAGEMVQWVKSLAAMPTNLSLTQATHMVKGETDSQKLSSDPNIKTYTLTNGMTYFFKVYGSVPHVMYVLCVSHWGSSTSLAGNIRPGCEHRSLGFEKNAFSAFVILGKFLNIFRIQQVAHQNETIKGSVLWTRN